ncbi:glycosyltransferase family A protein [Spiribacter roseus]|uniref:Glycosyltransferase family A protein n=1 Tax=Spiribacter roseus TaxID=1855875 RepID=A0ABV3RX71_9GAMM
MTSPAKITVVVPAFNVDRYVRSALDSLVSQTRKADEVIIIDDGSTDETSEILAEYKGVPGWRIVKIRNNGLGPARNLGRALAKSDYIYFFDSDDLLKQGFIERVHELIGKYQRPDMILFGGETFYDEGFEHPFAPNYVRTVEGEFGPGDHLITELAQRGQISASACLYVTKTALWSKNRLAYPAILHEDEAVFFPLLAVSRRTVAVAEAYFQRRVRRGSIMTRGFGADNATGMLRVLNETTEFMAREPSLVQPDRDAWRDRVKVFGSRYLSMARSAGIPLCRGSLVGSVIVARDLKYGVRVLFSLMPEPVRTGLRVLFRRDRRRDATKSR